MLDLCSLHLIPEEGQESKAYLAQIAKWPEAACHDGQNVIFRETHPLETDAIKAYLWVDANGKPLDEDSKAWAMAKIMADPNHPPIHDTKNGFNALFGHPAHRLWVGKYEDNEDQFTYDMEYMSAMIKAGMPEALPAWEAATNGKASSKIRGIMLAVIRQFSV